METIKEILIRRDQMTEEDADALIQDALEAFYDYLAANDEASAYQVCEEYFCLEPDYLDELMYM